MSAEEALELLTLPDGSAELDQLLDAAAAMSRSTSHGVGTIYSQIGINVWPCPENCDFCYLGAKHGIVKSPSELPLSEIVRRALEFEIAGADEVYLMTTANYPVDRFLEIGRRVRTVLDPATDLVANIGDFGLEIAKKLVDAGFKGVYHVYRFREGIDTEIDRDRRRSTFAAIRTAGLDLRYCIEPVGPEHTLQEIVGQMMLAREFGASVLSVMRRTPVPGTRFADSAVVSHAAIAKIVAVARLTLGHQVREMGVHEPGIESLRAGAHRICAEVGMNPRDLNAETAKGRGFSVRQCEELLAQAGFSHRSRVALS